MEVVGDVITTGQTMVKAMTQASEDLYNTLSTAASRATNTNFDVDSVLMQDHSDSQSGADAQHSTVTNINKFRSLNLLLYHFAPAEAYYFLQRQLSTSTHHTMFIQNYIYINKYIEFAKKVYWCTY